MRNLFLILIVLFVIVGCIESPKTSYSNHVSKAFNYNKFALIDTSTFDKVYKNDTGVIESNFKPLAIGSFNDTIIITYDNWNILKPIDSYNNDTLFQQTPNNSKIELFVDTTKIITNLSSFIPPPPLPNGKKLDLKVPPSYYSYPVFVRNKSNDTIWVGYGDYILLLMEAKDSLGSWKEIQKPFYYYCGTGVNDIILPPDNIVITSAYIFKGDFKTKLRIKTIGDYEVYSNEFDGYINYSQMVKKNRNKKK